MVVFPLLANRSTPTSNFIDSNKEILTFHKEKFEFNQESLEASKKICKALEDYDMCWIEDPIWMDRLDDIPKLAFSSHYPYIDQPHMHRRDGYDRIFDWIINNKKYYVFCKKRFV